MRLEIKDNILSVNIYDLLHDGIADKDKKLLAESLTCADFVIEKVMEQVFYGCTENGFSGSVVCTNNETRFSPLQKARRKIALESSEVAKQEISRLLFQVQHLEKTKNEYMNKYFELYHMGYRPELPTQE